MQAADDYAPAIQPDILDVSTDNVEASCVYKQDLLTVMASNAVMTAWSKAGLAVDASCAEMVASIIVQYAPQQTAAKLCGNDSIGEGVLRGCYMSEIGRITLNKDSMISPYMLSRTIAHEFVHVMTYCNHRPDDNHTDTRLWSTLSNDSVETLAMVSLGLYIVR